MGHFEDQPGGLNRYLYGLVTEQVRRGRHPTALVASDSAAELPFRVVARRSDPLPKRLFSFNQETRALIESHDLVDLHFSLNGVFLPFLRKPVPTVAHFQGPWAAEGRFGGEGLLKYALKSWVEWAAFKGVKEYIVLSSAFRTLLTTQYGISGANVTVIPPGVDLHTFSPGVSNLRRAQYGIDDEEPVVCVVRRLVPRMGLDFLLDVWAGLRRMRDCGILLIVGDGPERHRLKALASSLGVQQSVIFMGRVSDETLVSIYRSSVCSLVPTQAFEGFGLVAAESLAAGCPVLAANIDGLSCALADFPQCLLPANTQTVWEQHISRALDDHGLPSRSQCRTAAMRFSWEAVSDRVDDVYSRALERARR